MSMSEVTEAAERINQEIDPNTTRSMFGTTIDKDLDGMMRVTIIATGIGNIVEMPNVKTSKNQVKEKNNDLLDNIKEEAKSKFAEQPDLEDFTNPIIDIKKDTKSQISENKNNFNEEKTEPIKQSNSVMDFIKKLSPLKIFNLNKREKEVNEETSDTFLEKENNLDAETENKKLEEKVIINEETIINEDQEAKIEESGIKEDKKEIEEEKIEIENIKEVKVEPKEVEMKKEIEMKEEDNKTVEIQSEMPGLDDKIEEKQPSGNNNEEKEDLEIPSFLRNQSN